MTLKNAEVVLLSTNQKSNALRGYNDASLLFNYQENYIVIDAEKEFTSYFHLYIIVDDEIKEGDWCIYKHNTIVLLKKENIDKYGIIQLNGIGYDLQYCKKIIATTDTSLKIDAKLDNFAFSNDERNQLSQPSKSFISKYLEKYNKGNIIIDILVEYERKCNKCNYESQSEVYPKCIWADCVAKHKYKGKMIEKLKINSNNEITIKKVKSSWNREEVGLLITKAFKAGYERSNSGYPNTDKFIKPNIDKFIKENL